MDSKHFLIDRKPSLADLKPTPEELGHIQPLDDDLAIYIPPTTDHLLDGDAPHLALLRPMFDRAMNTAQAASMLVRPGFPRKYTIGELSHFNGHARLEDPKMIDGVLRMIAVQSGETALDTLFGLVSRSMATAFTTLYWLDSFKCYCVRGESVGSLGGIVSTMEEVSLMLPVAGKADLDMLRALPYRFRFRGGPIDGVETFPAFPLIEDAIATVKQEKEENTKKRKLAEMDPLTAIKAEQKNFSDLMYSSSWSLKRFSTEMHKLPSERAYFQTYDSLWSEGCSNCVKHGIPCYRQCDDAPHKCAFCIFTNNEECGDRHEWRNSFKQMESSRNSLNDISVRIHDLVKFERKLADLGWEEGPELKAIIRALFSDYQTAASYYERVEIGAWQLAGYDRNWTTIVNNERWRKLEIYFSE